MCKCIPLRFSGGSGRRQTFLRLLVLALLTALPLFRAQAQGSLTGVILQSDFSTLKSIWIGNHTYPTPSPDYVTVMFLAAKTIDTLVAATPSSNNAGGGTTCGVRDYRFQITTDGTNWQTKKSVAGNTSEWVLYANFPAVANVKGVRIQITKVNNGRWFDDYNSYLAYQNGVLKPYYGSALHATLYELEAYGP